MVYMHLYRIRGGQYELTFSHSMDLSDSRAIVGAERFYSLTDAKRQARTYNQTQGYRAHNF